ncbi:bifunctional diguanylate cyclase/phosphodiesterase [Robertmurraya andreesenii]|uniref:Diguanylate cyclase (GGDEF)-like protein/PAS domain S-box-containing protein n=1 Tax=Anoxybacillus andreesenii TaxID=1325932 RepID=A0ABT9UYW8_9BACL|nr:EAL domain-containing protein [Robertmurraya andreesenii]MDQ0153840.1 diguanylate cyclase (GGDEF)-like protein/PAS domain S-box-containing protein [Robertmurraya andreesenii]
MIKTISYVYENTDDLLHFIEENDLCEYPNILIQVFSGVLDRNVLHSIQSSIKNSLPLAQVIGCSAFGGIHNGQITSDEIGITFTIFEKTEIKSGLFQLEDYADGHDLGKNIVSSLCDFDTKALILFTTNYGIDVQALLDSIYEENPEIVLAGGVAGGDDIFRDGLVFNQEKISNQGVMAVALTSSQLRVRAFSNYKHQEVGKTFTITKAKGTAIYSIDHKKPIQLLEAYLGQDFISNLQQMRAEFPFIYESQAKRTSIRINKLLDNGAIEVSHNVDEGDSIVFAYAQLRTIIDNSLREMKRLSKLNMETIFVYNCVVRKNLLHDFADKEVEMLESVAPTNGFFLNGEISSGAGRRPEIVGNSLSYLALSENQQTQSKGKQNFQYKIPEKLQTIIALTHLMKASQEDIHILNNNIQISEQYYRSLFDNNTDIVYSTDLQGNFTSVNPAFLRMFGYKKEELIGKSALKYVNQDDLARVRMHFFRAIKGKEQYYTIELLSKTGEKNIFQLKNIPITVNGECVGIYGIGRNITEQKMIEDRMIQLAYFDQDTGLPNRIKFTEILGQQLARAKKKKRILAVMVIDMDRFKIINDSLGHEAGDEILREISERIQQALPTGSYLGRFSGDKFNLVLSKNVDVEEVVKIAKSILRQVSTPIIHSGQEFYVTASIGVSFYPNDGKDEISLLKNADIAMNRSKYPGGDRITLYSNEMNEEAMKRLELESYLRKALQKEEFFICYQPLIDLNTGKVFGSEALIRWNHPRLGLVSPGDFIPLAEETGLIEEIGSWVLRTACKQNKKWQQMGLKDLSVSVNVSANQFGQAKFVKEVKRALKESGMAPEFLTLELTESTMLRNIDHSIEVMRALQKLGVRVSIDDFGTGYSSLSYLKDLPINTLKIDRTFINNLHLDTTDIAIVKAIITMGHGLSMKVVAEGVETEAQIELLKELKCHYAQGFYLHRPLTTDDFEKAMFTEKYA